MSRCSMRSILVMLASLLPFGAIQAQTADAPGCSLEKQVYTCDWQAFVHRLHRAHTVEIETQSLDKFTARQLRQLAGELGKTVAPEDQPADLTFLLIPLQSTGLHIGPGGEPLATLRIYTPQPGNARGTLVWAETYTGQPDRPWPATVHALIEQFQDRLQKH